MSPIHGNGDLKLMNEYDFNTPIQATIIIYDDEEESKPVEEESNNCDTTRNLDDIVIGIINDISKATNKDNHETSNQKTITECTSDNGECTNRAGHDKRNDLIYEALKKTFNQVENSNQTLLIDTQPSSNNNIDTTSEENNRRPKVFIQQADPYSSQDDTNHRINKSIQELLNTVSMHMIFIFKAYDDYRTTVLRTLDTAVIQKASMRYYDSKCRFFNLSFSTVSNIMIPRENEKDFLKNFIKDTVKLAKTIHLYFHPSKMEMLLKKMFDWVKSRMQYPVLANLLQTESAINSCLGLQMSKTSNVDNTCVFRCGSEGRELTKTFNTNIAMETHSTNQQYNDPHKLRSNKDYHAHRFQPYQTGKEIPTHPYKSMQRHCSNLVNKEQVQPYHNQLTVPSTTAISPQNTEAPITTSDYFYNNYQNEQEHLEVSKSISRDSVYMSPLNSVPSDPVSPRYEFDPSAVTPMITHVTSLNPSVAYISDGVCHVCGTLTRKKCLGCYKCYYCSHQCQTADWKYHFDICK